MINISDVISLSGNHKNTEFWLFNCPDFNTVFNRVDTVFHKIDANSDENGTVSDEINSTPDEVDAVLKMHYFEYCEISVKSKVWKIGIYNRHFNADEISLTFHEDGTVFIKDGVDIVRVDADSDEDGIDFLRIWEKYAKGLSKHHYWRSILLKIGLWVSKTFVISILNNATLLTLQYNVIIFVIKIVVIFVNYFSLWLYPKNTNTYGSLNNGN
jgi:hypothetical protein